MKNITHFKQDVKKRNSLFCTELCTSALQLKVNHLSILVAIMAGKYHLHITCKYCNFLSSIAGVALTTDYVTASTEIGLNCNSAILNGLIASLCNHY